MAERFQSMAQVRAEEQRLRELRDAERQRLDRSLKAVADPGFRRDLLYNGVRRTVGGVHWLRVLGDVLLPPGRERVTYDRSPQGAADAGRIAGGLLRMALPGLLAYFVTPERLERMGVEAGRSLVRLRARWRQRRSERRKGG
jgi:hypothetical protein